MRTMKLLAFALLLAFTAAAQSDPWAPIRIFEGKWQGTVTGKPGTQFSRREYRFELDGKFLSQHDDSVYEAKSPDGRQRTRVDFGFFSYDKIAQKLVWRQFHSEGFVNEYTLESVSAEGRSFDFVTRYIENQPPGFRAKKSYRIISPDEIEETFSLAPPGADFSVFTVAHLKRIIP